MQISININNRTSTRSEVQLPVLCLMPNWSRILKYSSRKKGKLFMEVVINITGY